MAEKIRLEDRECPLSATLGLVGEWWTLLILHDAFGGHDLEERDESVAQPEPVREFDGAAREVAFEVGVHVMAFDAVDRTPADRAPHLDGVLVGSGHLRSPLPDPGVTVPLLVLVEHGRVVREAGDDGVDVTTVRSCEVLGDDRGQRARHDGVLSVG